MRLSSSFPWFIPALIIALTISLVAASGGNWSAKAASDAPLAGQSFALGQIEHRITMAESQITDIRPGLEKSIIWAGAPHQRTRYAIVYIHGFSASKEELRPVPDRIAVALGANIFYTRLTGHGRTAEAMREASVAAWMQDLAETFQIGSMIGDKVIIISCSTGGTLVAAGMATRSDIEHNATLINVMQLVADVRMTDEVLDLLARPDAAA